MKSNTDFLEPRRRDVMRRLEQEIAAACSVGAVPP